MSAGLPCMCASLQWGVKLPLGSSGSCSTGGQSSNGAGTIMTALQQQQQPAQLFGPVVAFYLGKAGAHRRGQLLVVSYICTGSCHSNAS